MPICKILHCDTKNPIHEAVLCRDWCQSVSRNFGKKYPRSAKRTARKCTGEMEGQPPTTNGGSNDCEILDELMTLTDWKKP